MNKFVRIVVSALSAVVIIGAFISITYATFNCRNSEDTKNEMTSTQTVNNYRPDAKFKVTKIDSIPNTDMLIISVTTNNEPSALVNVFCPKSKNIILNQIVELIDVAYMQTSASKTTAKFIK